MHGNKEASMLHLETLHFSLILFGLVFMQCLKGVKIGRLAKKKMSGKAANTL